MDLVISHSLDHKNINICCCCLKQDCTNNDIPTELVYTDLKKCHGDMLKETFDIQISSLCEAIEYNHLICEDCVTQLQTAVTFKQTVIRSVEIFTEYLKNKSESKDKLDIVDEDNTEEVGSANDIDLINDTSMHDNETLSDIKIESSEVKNNHNWEEKKLKKHTKHKKCKIKIESDNLKESNHKDWKKILERRGSGPILRENTLKLLANSSICVFQWNKSRYRCFCCKEPFSDLDSLREHSNTNHALEDIEKKIILQQNRLVKVEVSRISCKLCSNELRNLLELRHHLTDKHAVTFTLEEDLLVPFKINAQLQCQICLEQFTVFRLLNIHMNKHFQKQVCHICGTGFSNLVFLNLHKTRSHRPLTCKECDVTFINKAEKRKHDTTVHGVKTERKLRFPCPYCQERFFQENFRVQHLVEKHGMIRPEHKCTVCSKVFITRSLRNNHVKNVHMKEKNQECDICHHFFYTKSDVLRHRVTHTGEKKFCCSICTSPFATKDSLRRHMKRTHVTVQ